MVKYKGLYKDVFGITEINIENDFDNLFLEIDGVKFIGSEFSDFEIHETQNYSKIQVERFSFFSLPINGTDKFKKTLCNCSFNIIIPQIIISQQTNQFFETNLNLNYTLGKVKTNNNGLDYENMIVSIVIDKKEYRGESGYIETAFDQIQEQFDELYKFKNCYGCMYGDYSVYGQSGFGSMLCYVNQKDEYIKVRTKQDYLLNLNTDYKKVQEIFCCLKYELRKKGIGYRG